MAATIFTTAQVAAKLDTSPRNLRKFLRSAQGFDAKVGKGSRWGIEAKEMRSLTKRFTAWTAANDAKVAAKVDSTDAPETAADDA